MKCRFCNDRAVINLRAYNISLCKNHLTWFVEKRTHDTIRKYRLIQMEDTLLVAVSGGKDSLSLWNILKKSGYKADGLYIHLGIDSYSDESLKKAISFAESICGRLYVVNLKEIFNRGINEIARFLRRTYCSACGTLKRYIMNRICMDKGYTALATGHNLDDEASALLGNLLYWKEEYLWKKNPLLEVEEGHLVRKVKPFFFLSEKEIAAYAVVSGIDYIYQECPYSRGAKTLLYKEILNRIEEESPGTKLGFLKGYLKRAKIERKEGKPMKYCSVCSYPSFGEKCVFCSLTERLNPSLSFTYVEYDFGR